MNQSATPTTPHQPVRLLFTPSTQHQPVRLLLTTKEAAAACGISIKSFHKLRDELPKPVMLGARCLRWSVADLQAAIAAMPRHTEAEEPPQLLRGKELLRAKVEALMKPGTGDSPSTQR